MQTTTLPMQASGPLSGYLPGFIQELERQGYARFTVQAHRCLATQFSQWVAAQGLEISELTTEHVRRFTRYARILQYAHHRSERALKPLISYLREKGLIRERPQADSPLESMVERYRRYLTVERGLLEKTVDAYLATARLFLSTRVVGHRLDLDNLTAAEVTKYVLKGCRRRSPGSAKCFVKHLRSLLRFLHVEGWTPPELAMAVPAVAGWRGASLPRALDRRTVAALLASCDRTTTVGVRDYAILLLLARVGLRAGEAAALELDDVDWVRGEFTVRGKGSREERLPLPADVGAAMVEYLQRRPPHVECRKIFLQVRAPIRGLTREGVTNLVHKACDRAGVHRLGPHRLRHTAATEMLAGGATLSEIGEVLRHRSQMVTAMYAKVDRTALRALARPWPGSAMPGGAA